MSCSSDLCALENEPLRGAEMSESTYTSLMLKTHRNNGLNGKYHNANALPDLDQTSGLLIAIIFNFMRKPYIRGIYDTIVQWLPIISSYDKTALVLAV